MNEKLNWGIIGPGSIAHAFAHGLRTSETGRLLAVASRSQGNADKFADEFGAAHRHASYEAILSDKDVQAVYIATPHPFHAEWAIRAARAGKHVLVEKPAGINHVQLTAMIEAAIENGVFLMEAFMYRCHPQTARLVELIRDKAIGEVRIIESAFSFNADPDERSRLLANELAGGAILDIGCYPLSVSRLIAGAAAGKDFAEPIEVKGTAHLGQTGVDEWAVAALRFPGGLLAHAAAAVGVHQDYTLRIYGSEGRIIVPSAWTLNRVEPEQGKIVLYRNGDSAPREIIIPARATSYAYEADVVGKAVWAGLKQAPAPAMSWEDSLGNLRAMDRWRESIGLTYEMEKPVAYPKVTVGGSPLSVAASHNMKYGRIDGLDKPVSRLVIGTDNQRTFAQAAIMFDDYFERGGNTFDTAYVYDNGDRLLGQWIKHRGVRQQAVIIAKGAHTPHCDPKSLSRQLIESLERMETDYADIYLMHRDNPQVPVGEFIDVLNEHVRAGRIKLFGGSNWTLARVDEANTYARKRNRQPFSVLSNNFSLARMIDGPWAGCISTSDPDSRVWLTSRQLPLLAWSSQARGFFVDGRADPDKLDDKDLVRCWYSPDNFQRLERARELAKKKKVLPINIALAYVLCQPFPTYALIGPRLLSETRTTLAGLDVELTGEEMKWVNLEI